MPLIKHNSFNFNSKTNKSICQQLSEFNFNNNDSKSLDDGNSSPSSSLASADSGTESPELESPDSGSGFSPGFELERSNAPVDIFTEMFSCISPTNFRRHNSIITDDKNTLLSYSLSLKNEENIIDCSIDDLQAKFNFLPSSNIVLQNFTNQQNLINSKNWNTFNNIKTMPKIINNNDHLIKNEIKSSVEKIETLRRASDSSLGSNGVAEITTPSTTASLNSSDELWSNNLNNNTVNETNNVEADNIDVVAVNSAIRLPVFEQMSRESF